MAASGEPAEVIRAGMSTASGDSDGCARKDCDGAEESERVESREVVREPSGLGSGRAEGCCVVEDMSAIDCVDESSAGACDGSAVDCEYESCLSIRALACARSSNASLEAAALIASKAGSP